MEGRSGVDYLHCSILFCPPSCFMYRPLGEPLADQIFKCVEFRFHPVCKRSDLAGSRNCGHLLLVFGPVAVQV